MFRSSLIRWDLAAGRIRWCLSIQWGFRTTEGLRRVCLTVLSRSFWSGYLEATGTGLLAIGVRGQGPYVFIRDHETGLLVEPHTVKSLIASLSELFANPVEKQLIAIKGKHHGREHLIAGFC